MAATDGLVGYVLNGTYRLTRPIAPGGMGDVYEAVHVRLASKRYAVKLLHPGLADDPELLGRFEREARIVSDLGHPNIVEVIDCNCTEEGQPFIVMEFLEGETLASWIQREAPLPPRPLVRVLDQAGAALQTVHDRGIVHRDMKPDNIFLVEGDPPLVKVLDFGICKVRESRSIMTEEHVLLGTCHYMSPEQASGDHQKEDHTTDIFALGVVAYEALTGQRPFTAPNVPAVVYRVLFDEPPPPSKVNPRLPYTVDPVIACAMAKDKQKRYQRVEHFIAALGRAVGGPGPDSPNTTPAGSGMWRSSGR